MNNNNEFPEITESEAVNESGANIFEKTEIPSAEAIESLSISSIVYDVFSSFMTAMIIVCVMFTFLFRLVCVDGDSMKNTLHNGEWLIISNFFYEPEYKDIIIASREISNQKPIVKRVIGVGGDVVDIDFNTHQVKVNGVVLEEPYIAEPTSRKGETVFPLTVPEGYVFVMGDNRNNSLDSRFSAIGLISENRLLGKTVLRLNPFGKVD